MQSFILSYVFYFCVSIFFFGSCIRLLLSDFVKIHFPGLTERNGRPYQQLVRSDTDIRHVSAGSRSRLSVDMKARDVK